MMETNRMTKKILDFQKGAISQWYDVMTSMQEQAASSLRTVLDQSGWIPDEGRQMVQNWVSACKKGCHDYKELVEESISGFEKVFVVPSKKTATDRRTTATKRTTAKAKPAAPAKAKAPAAAAKPAEPAKPVAAPKAAKPAAAPKAAEPAKPAAVPKADTMEKATELAANKDKTAK
jgi:hypothetical protein